MSLSRRFLLVLIFVALEGGRLLGQQISSFSPTFGTPPGSPGSKGDAVTINGSGFYPGTLAVYYHGTRDPFAQATAADGTVIQSYVPYGATTGPITVTVNGSSASSTEDFTVIGPGPYVASFSPNVGSANTLVTIQGAHFDKASGVLFGGILGVNFNNSSFNQIQVNAPAGVTNGPLSVTSASYPTFVSSNFYVPPTLTGFSPSTGRSGTNVTLTGINLSGATSVLFNGLSAGLDPATATNNTSLRVTVPVGASTGPVRVNTPAGSFTTASNFVVQPTIFGFSPPGGPAGTSVTLTGANFNAGTPVVRFNGVASTIISNISFGQLNAVVPATATTGFISITNNSGSYTNATYFYVTPTITGFTPTNSAPGTTVTITGKNFLGATNVAFNGASSVFTPPTTNTTIQTVVPENVTTGPITVSTPGGSVTSTALFYGPPVISSFAPTHGLPGTNVTITGTNFLGATVVKFNGLTASFTPPTNNTTIRAVVPANAQTGPITVVAPAGTNTSAAVFVLDYNSDLTLGMQDAPDPVFIGSNLVYTLSITNKGPFTAYGVGLTNVLPSSVTLVSATTSQGSLATNSNPVLGSLGTLTVGASANLTFTVTPSVPGTITNQASVTATNTDPALGNNSVSLTTTVLPLPVLSAALVGSNRVQLSWPVLLTNFVLQARSNLAPGTVWANVGTVPVITGGQNVVVETNSLAARFYRLKK